MSKICCCCRLLNGSRPKVTQTCCLPAPRAEVDGGFPGTASQGQEGRATSVNSTEDLYPCLFKDLETARYLPPGPALLNIFIHFTAPSLTLSFPRPSLKMTLVIALGPIWTFEGTLLHSESLTSSYLPRPFCWRDDSY